MWVHEKLPVNDKGVSGKKKKQVDCSDSSTQAITSVLGEELNDFGK